MRTSPALLSFAVGAALCWVISSNSSIADDAEKTALVTLSLPRPASASEAVWLEVRGGKLPHGADIVVSTREGELLGTVSLVGGSQGSQGTGTFSSLLPLPKSAIVNGQINLTIEVDAPGGSVRAPRPGEVESIELIYVPVGN